MNPDKLKAAATAGVPVAYFVLAEFSASTAALTVCGLALLVAPGYLWSEMILDRTVHGLERVAVCAGLTLAIPVILGLILYEGGVPLDRRTWATVLGCLVLAGDVVLLSLRRPVTQARVSIPRGVLPHAGRFLVFTVAAFCAVGAIAVARVGAAEQRYPGFTELWLTPQRNNALEADVGVINHQGSATHYRLVVVRGGRVEGSWEVVLSDGGSWQRAIPTANRRVIARLYRLPDLARPYRHVTLNYGGARGS
jgi:hypothetical protein